MNADHSDCSLFLKPSALVPLGMSVVALAMVLVHTALYGIVHEPDEGTAAHIFQILMVAQLPVIVYFVLRWLIVRPGQATLVLAFQAIAWLAAIASVYWLT